jgi:hypothetical protein
MLFSCSWPAYQDEPDYDLISYYCNLWRNYDDIFDSWESVSAIIDYYGFNQELFSYYNSNYYKLFVLFFSNNLKSSFVLQFQIQFTLF